MRNNLLLLHFFSIFLNPQRVTLTYSAMTDGPIDVQLRWANLRAREHHVKGPKKSPRKMVLRRLILRKAEEAKPAPLDPAQFSLSRHGHCTRYGAQVVVLFAS